MNRDCHGDFFNFRGHKLYCCFANGGIVDAKALADYSECPECKRTIKGNTLTVEPLSDTVTFVEVAGRRVELPKQFLFPLEPIAPLEPTQPNESH